MAKEGSLHALTNGFYLQDLEYIFKILNFSKIFEEKITFFKKFQDLESEIASNLCIKLKHNHIIKRMIFFKVCMKKMMFFCNSTIFFQMGKGGQKIRMRPIQLESQ